MQANGGRRKSVSFAIRAYSELNNWKRKLLSELAYAGVPFDKEKLNAHKPLNVMNKGRIAAISFCQSDFKAGMSVWIGSIKLTSMSLLSISSSGSNILSSNTCLTRSLTPPQSSKKSLTCS